VLVSPLSFCSVLRVSLSQSLNLCQVADSGTIYFCSGIQRPSNVANSQHDATLSAVVAFNGLRRGGRRCTRLDPEGKEVYIAFKEIIVDSATHL
jgi:hypothetical protein